MPAGSGFCPSCGEKAPQITPPPSGTPSPGPNRLQMPAGLPDIDLSPYGREKSRAIERINLLSDQERQAWVGSGQPYILGWTAGDFMTWLRLTDPTAQAPTAVTSASGYTRPQPSPTPPTNPPATAGFVLALTGWFLFFLVIPIILGIVFSSVGITRAREIEQQTGRAVGRGLAIAGLIISLVAAFLTFIAFIVFWAI